MPLAKEDLQSIHDFIAEDSPTIAKRFIKKLISKTEKIKNFPKIGRALPDYKPKDVREIIYGNYRIIYYVRSEAKVDILTIFHSRRNLKDTDLSGLINE